MIEAGEKALILVVDDEPGNVGYLNQILSDEFRVRVALDGETALRMANVEPRPDLIMLDIIMPGIDGLEVCRRLKSNWSTRDIPVIFVTVRDQEADELAGLGLGAVDYITKPFSPPVVLARARTQVGLKRAREELKLQNQELLEAAKLREAMEQITRHDLKNPLGIILGSLDLLMDDELLYGQSQRLEAIRGAAYRMLDLINLTLDTYKIEHGTYIFTPQPVDLLKLVETIQGELAGLIKAKNIFFKITLDGRAPRAGETCLVLGEELLCYCMLANLIRNAAEASPKGGLVDLDFGSREEVVRLAIGNSGVVPVDIRERFFEKYVTHGKRGGTGLGTYSARLLACLHGGDTAMSTSDQEQRTEVTVTLPAYFSGLDNGFQQGANP